MLQKENLELKAKIKELEEKLNKKEEMDWEPPFYWVNNGDAKDGPFCQKCYDSESKLIRLQNADKGAWRCVSCNNNFFEGSNRPSGLDVGVVKPRSR